MNPHTVMKEMELAAWEMAEAETRERSAAMLRTRAAKRLAAVHAEMAAALKQAEATKKTNPARRHGLQTH